MCGGSPAVNRFQFRPQNASSCFGARRPSRVSGALERGRQAGQGFFQAWGSSGGVPGGLSGCWAHLATPTEGQGQVPPTPRIWKVVQTSVFWPLS